MGGTDMILGYVRDERERQDRLVASGSVSWDCTNPDVIGHAKLSVLAEEFGEVARALLDGDLQHLRQELIQVAAVAVAWAESLDIQ